MDDNELKQKLRSFEVPPPSKEASERAKDAAMQAFLAHQQKKEKTTQGLLPSTRPIHNPMPIWEEWIRRFSMKKAYIFAGSLITATLVLAVTTTHYSTIMGPVVSDVVQTASTAVNPEPDNKLAQSLASQEPTEQQKTVPAKSSMPMDQGQPFPPAAPPPPAPPSPAPRAAVALKDTGLNQAQTMAEMAAPPHEESKQDVAASKPALALAGSATTSSMADARGRMHYAKEKSEMAKVMPPIYSPVPQPIYSGQDKFESFVPNTVKLTKEEPVSTFSIDVDTSSYSFVRRMLNMGTLPQNDMVRVEEMINYFDYSYPLPESRDVPFKPTVTVYPTPWNADTKLLHIGIKGHDIAKAEKPRSNLVFLIDVSGSMNSQDKLPLVKNALRMLVDQLSPHDTVGIVVYAGSVGTVLEPTSIQDKGKILEALNRLEAGGSTAGGEGIRQAYALAESHLDKKAVNRVILATDGDFNVGITDPQALQDFIEKKRESGIFLSILGFGQGNYNDALMQKLAQHGNGTAAYIDNLNEARKVLVEEASSTLFTIAKDVKIQIEFNPAVVSEYRLIGYESRLLKREDFNNDKVDAGEVGSGHAITAIYEITPTTSKTKQIDDLRYSKEVVTAAEKNNFSGEYAFLKMRYKLPDANESKLLTTPITSAQEVKDVKAASEDVRFATSVAAFGQLLKGDTHLKNYSYDDILTLAETARGKDAFGYRAEFMNLVRLAKAQQGSNQSGAMPVD